MVIIITSIPFVSFNYLCLVLKIYEYPSLKSTLSTKTWTIGACEGGGGGGGANAPRAPPLATGLKLVFTNVTSILKFSPSVAVNIE